MSSRIRAAFCGRRYTSLLVAAIGLDALPARAQQGLNAPITLSEIVVSPNAVPTPAADIGSSVSVLTSDDLQYEQRRTVPEALQQLPGLNVVPIGGPGGQTSVFIRGTNANHVKVLIDGIDATDPSNPNGTFDFGQLLASDIDRVEVLRGPQSGLYGSDAIGGVISVFTKKGEGPPKAYVRLEGGSFGTFNQSMGFSGGTPIYDYAFNVAHFSARDIPVTPAELLPPGQRAIGNFYDNWTLSSKLGVHIGDSVYAETSLRYLDSQLRFTGNDVSMVPAPPEAQQSEQNTQQLFTRVAVHYDPIGTTIKNRVGVSYTLANTTNESPDTALGPTPLMTNLGERLKYDYQGQFDVVKGETLIYGAETETTRLDVRPTFARNANTAGYLQLLSNVGDRAFLASNVRYDENERFGGRTTFRLAPSFHLPVTETILKGSYGTGFKAPSLNQLFVNLPAFNFFANPNLKPEESTGYDAGFEQSLLRNRLSFGGTYFQNNIRNLIDTNATFTSYMNVGRAKAYGAESFIVANVREDLRVRADYTFTISRDEILMQELLRRPRHKGSVQAFWTPIERVTLSATLIAIGRFVDGNRDFSVTRLVNRGHTTINLAATYDVTPQARLFGRIDNIFDLRYQDPTGYLGLSRAAYGGVQYTF